MPSKASVTVLLLRNVLLRLELLLLLLLLLHGDLLLRPRVSLSGCGCCDCCDAIKFHCGE